MVLQYLRSPHICVSLASSEFRLVQAGYDVAKTSEPQIKNVMRNMNPQLRLTAGAYVC
jgi:hypothetical protein